MAGRIWQKDKGNTKASKRARTAWWIVILDNDGQKITRKIGERDVAQKVLNKFNSLKDRGLLHKNSLDQKMSYYFDRYLEDKKSVVADYEGLKSSVTFLKNHFGKYRTSEMTSNLFRTIRTKWFDSVNNIRKSGV